MISLEAVSKSAANGKLGAGWHISKANARKGMWIGLAAIAAVRLYFVQEMIAALILFTAVFMVFAVVALVMFLLDQASQRTVAWAEPQARHAVELTQRATHRAWVAAEPVAAEVSKRLHHHLHSQTAR